MELIELCLPDGLREGIAERARAWCEAMDKTAIEVPDQPGFVVNRLLFPYLFDAVRLLERDGDDAPTTSTPACGSAPATRWGRCGCSTSSASTSPRRSARACSPTPARSRYRPPGPDRGLIGEGKLGRKAGAGFYEY